MGTVPLIAEAASAKGIPFLLAGGHAVIIHGFPRSTFDLDLIVRREHLKEWLSLLYALGYSLHHEANAFVQMNPPEPGAYPVDLMLVNNITFEKLWAAAVPAPTWPAVKVVSLMSLLALKCHAAKHGHPGRVIKDADDVIRLVRNNKLDADSEELRSLFLHHRTEECTKRSDEPAREIDATSLEFPDWSGTDDSSPRITPEAALLLCENYPRLAAAALKGKQIERPQPCPVEFVL